MTSSSFPRLDPETGPGSLFCGRVRTYRPGRRRGLLGDGREGDVREWMSTGRAGRGSVRGRGFVLPWEGQGTWCRFRGCVLVIQ